MYTTKDSYKKFSKKSEEFARALEKVLKKFKETKLGEYDNINLDYYKTFVKKKSSHIRAAGNINRLFYPGVSRFPGVPVGLW